MRKPGLAVISAVVVWLAPGWIASAQQPQPFVGPFTLVSSTRFSRVEFDYVYRIQFTNPGGALVNVSASVQSASPHTVILDPEVVLGNVSAGATTMSSDTFTLRHNRTVPFNLAALQWTVDAQPATPPVDATVIPQADRAIAADVVLGEGGTVSTTSAEGLVYTLVIPSQAMNQSLVVVTVTPIDDLVGLPTGLQFLAGVDLQPEGLALYPAATLTITAPSAIDISDVFAFGYTGAGKDFHMLPHADWPAIGSSAELTVSHFSGAGVAAGASTATALTPAGSAAQLEQQLATVLQNAKGSGILPWYDAGSRGEFSTLMTRSFEANVRPALVAAELKVKTSLASRPWEAPGLAALEATQLAARAFLAWMVQLRAWDDEVFPPRHEPPLDWPYARSLESWSGFYADIGLAAALDSDIADATSSLDFDLRVGPQDNACTALSALDYCLKYDYLEMALNWAGLNFMAGSYNPASVISELDIDAYCGGIIATYVGEIALLPGPDVKLTVGENVEITAIAMSVATGVPLDPQPPIVWETADHEVATVSSTGLVTAGSQGRTTLVAGDGQACRSGSADVYVYPPPFSVAGTGSTACERVQQCGCGNLGSPPQCEDLLSSRSGEISLKVTMNTDYQMGFTATQKGEVAWVCADGSSPGTAPLETSSWSFNGNPWDDQANSIRPWALGTPGNTHFNYAVERNVDGIYLPIQFSGDAGPGGSIGSMVIHDDPICRGEIFLH